MTDYVTFADLHEMIERLEYNQRTFLRNGGIPYLFVYGRSALDRSKQFYPRRRRTTKRKGIAP